MNGAFGFSFPRRVTVPYINVQDQKAQNTSGGTFTTGADRTRDLNTIETDTAGIASLASNQLTLPAGQYRFEIVCPAYSCGRNQAFLYNVTDAVVVRRGTAAYTTAGAADDACYSIVKGSMTIFSSKAFEVRHVCSNTQATRGFGVEANFGIEIYTIAEFWKIG
jgi:hypothetical protein